MMTAIEALYREELDHGRAIRLWLYAMAALVFAMVVVGGATRLTESGLSITEWQPVTGTLPPLNEAQWQIEFQKYQTIPQYHALNAGMSLADFKTIYWWEWGHRLIGRVIGVAFFVPFQWFLWRGWIPLHRCAGLWIILALGALQGAIGWWMVASGLADRVEVSQYRLATHLVLACLIYVALVWTGVRWEDERTPSLFQDAGKTTQPVTNRAGAIALVVLLLAQIYLGALVAGLRAGHAYNTWPLIDGGLIPQPSRLLFEVPLWRNFFENPLTVQFDHRMVGYVIDLSALLHLFNVATGQARSRLHQCDSCRRGSHRASNARDLDAAVGRRAAACAFASGGCHDHADFCGHSRSTRNAAKGGSSDIIFDIGGDETSICSRQQVFQEKSEYLDAPVTDRARALV
jgi:cytochrome c oxidase assembly protein subunit 15